MNLQRILWTVALWSPFTLAVAAVVGLRGA